MQGYVTNIIGWSSLLNYGTASGSDRIQALNNKDRNYDW